MVGRCAMPTTQSSVGSWATTSISMPEARRRGRSAVLRPAGAVGHDRVAVISSRPVAVPSSASWPPRTLLALAEGAAPPRAGCRRRPPAVVEHDHPVAELADLVQAVGDEHDRAPSRWNALMRSRHLRWNGSSPTGEHLVDEQDLRVDVDGDGEGQPDVHAARVELDLGVDELLDAGEVDDVVEVGVGLVPGQAEDRGVEVDVLPPGQVAVEAGAELEQGGQPAAALDVAARRASGSRRSP